VKPTTTVSISSFETSPRNCSRSSILSRIFPEDDEYLSDLLDGLGTLSKQQSAREGGEGGGGGISGGGGGGEKEADKMMG